MRHKWVKIICLENENTPTACLKAFLNGVAMKSSRQKRFLEAYRERPKIANAARLAGVHRATIYRWQTNPAFAETMRMAKQAYLDEFLRIEHAAIAERAKHRAEHERNRRPMRCRVLEHARAMKRLRRELRERLQVSSRVIGLLLLRNLDCADSR